MDGGILVPGLVCDGTLSPTHQPAEAGSWGSAPAITLGVCFYIDPSWLPFGQMPYIVGIFRPRPCRLILDRPCPRQLSESGVLCSGPVAETSCVDVRARGRYLVVFPIILVHYFSLNVLFCILRLYIASCILLCTRMLCFVV